jgi:hypothetical protein
MTFLGPRSRRDGRNAPRGARRLRRPIASALAALATVAVLAGCDRTPRFVPAAADSTVVTSDSLAIQVERARAGWDAGGGQGAAELTARVVFEDLRAHADQPMAVRARVLIDSLGFGAEVAGRPAVTAVNIFAAANPTGESWPFLFWRDRAGTAYQRLQGGGLRLVDLAAEGGEGTASGEIGASRVALLFHRAAAGGLQPMVFVWRRAGEAWKLQQTLGSDSLGGTGTARFVAGEPDSAILVARTWRRTPGFDECASCPHLIRVRRLRWGREGLVMVSEQADPSPYGSFVRLIQALALGDREMAERVVTDPALVDAALGYEWGRPKGLWRAAPGADGRSGSMVFLRGNQEAYRLHFGARGGDWMITGFEPTSRSIE